MQPSDDPAWDEVYRHMRAIAGRFMRGQRRDHTLSPTALANEAFLRLSGWKNAETADQEHLVAVAATAMRQILVNHAKRRNRLKRGGGAARLTLGDGMAHTEGSQVDLVELNELVETLMKLDPRKARVVELRFFAGLTIAQVATLLDVSTFTVESDWRSARAWLLSQMRPEDASS